MDSERRRFRRFDVPLEVTLGHLDVGQSLSTGLTRNVSRDGLCIEIPLTVSKLEKRVGLKVKIPHIPEPIPILADVMWKRKLKDSWLAGLRMTSIDKEAKGELLDYAYDLWLDRMRSQN